MIDDVKLDEIEIRNIFLDDDEENIEENEEYQELLEVKKKLIKRKLLKGEIKLEIGKYANINYI